MMWIKLPEKIKSLIKSNAFLNWKKCVWIFLLVAIIGFGIILPIEYADAGLKGAVKSILETTVLGIIWLISYMGIMIASFFVSMASGFLDIVMQPGIYNEILGKAFEVDSDGNPTGFINVGWTAVRDLANMFFILILLFIAFGTILRIEAYKAKNLLPKLIIAIFLVNFSKIISLIAIDFSQVFMYSLYNQIGSFQASQGDSIGMVSQFASAYGPGTIGWPDISEAVGAFGACIFSFLLGLTYLALAAFMVIRLTMLCLVVVLSPVAFLLLVLPYTKQYFSKWLDNLIRYSIIGPVFVFFIWLSGLMAFQLFHASSQTFAVNIQDVPGAPMSGLSVAFENIIPFFVVIFMLLYSMSAAKQLGIWGAAAVDKATTGAGIAFGIAGGVMLGRMSKGGASRWLAKGGKMPRIPGAKGLRNWAGGTRLGKGYTDFRDKTRTYKAGKKKGQEYTIGGGFEKIQKGKETAVSMLSPEVLKRGYKAHIAEEEAEAYGVPAARLQDLANRVKGKETDYAELARLNEVARKQKMMTTENPFETVDFIKKAFESDDTAGVEAGLRKLAVQGNISFALKGFNKEDSDEGLSQFMQTEVKQLLGERAAAILTEDIDTLERRQGNYSYHNLAEYEGGKHQFADKGKHIKEAAKKFGSEDSRKTIRNMDARTFVKKIKVETSPGVYEDQHHLTDIGKEIIKNQYTTEHLNLTGQAKSQELKKIEEAIDRLDVSEMLAIGPRVTELNAKIKEVLK